MRAHGVIDNRHLRPGQAGEVADLAKMVHAHFDHRVAMRGGEAKQRQRQADIVVEVARGGVHGGGAGVGAQDGRHHFLDGGLAVGAGNADALHVEAGAPVCRQRTQRQAGIGHADHAALPCHLAADQCARAFGQHLGHEVVGIEFLAYQRHEQIAGLHGAAIGHHALETNITAQQLAAKHAGGVREHQHARPPTTSALLRRRGNRRTAASRRRCPGIPRGLYRRSVPRRQRGLAVPPSGWPLRG